MIINQHTYALNMDAVSMSDEEFFRFCHDNQPLRIERDHKKQIIIMSPTGSESGFLNFIISGQLYQWYKQTKNGKFFDSSAGFTLPDGSVRSPDASWVASSKWDELALAAKQRFAPICPDFVIELKSKKDAIDYLKSKMTDVWIKNGVQLGWLIDPEAKITYVYHADGSEEVVEGFQRKLSAGTILPDFALDLAELEVEE